MWCCQLEAQRLPQLVVMCLSTVGNLQAVTVELWCFSLGMPLLVVAVQSASLLELGTLLLAVQFLSKVVARLQQALLAGPFRS